MKNFADKLITAAVSACVMLQAWTLKEVVALKISVAQIETRLQADQRRDADQTAGLKHHERNP